MIYNIHDKFYFKMELATERLWEENKTRCKELKLSHIMCCLGMNPVNSKYAKKIVLGFPPCFIFSTTRLWPVPFLNRNKVFLWRLYHKLMSLALFFPQREFCQFYFQNLRHLGLEKGYVILY